MLLKQIVGSATNRSTENWVLHGFGRHVVRPGTVPNLGRENWEFEIWSRYQGRHGFVRPVVWTRGWAHQGFGRPIIGLLP